MPHKHRRGKGKNDSSFYDLPPSRNARPLPVKQIAAPTNSQPHKNSQARKSANLPNDTPRAFTRLLTAYRPPRSGLDDGIRLSKKRKISRTATEEKATAPPPFISIPTIEAHEPLSSFNARVDAALPFNGLSKKSGGVKGLESGRKTKTERKMQKMQREWREEEQRREEKVEEEKDEALVNEDGVDDMVKEAKKARRKNGKRKSRGENGIDISDEDDPWANIAAKRLAENHDSTRNGLVGLHDVVQAPPRFSKVPKGKENLNVGKVTGGLRRQMELSEARKSVVDGYRQMMKDKRGKDE